MTGISLWCSGDIELLLAKGRRVQLFANPDNMLAALMSSKHDHTPPAVTDLDAKTLRNVINAPLDTDDLDAAGDWFRRPDRSVTLEACNDALNALNMATDIGVTAGDERVAEIVASDVFDRIHEALTFGVTILGEGSPFYRDPATMVEAITPKTVAAVSELVALAATNVEVR